MALISVSIPKTVHYSHEDDLQIKEQRPVLNVVEVVLDTLIDRCVSAPSVNLGPTCDSRGNLVS